MAETCDEIMKMPLIWCKAKVFQKGFP